MEQKNKLILPKPHLSWSAISCWNSNPERFRREYFENGQKLDTKFLRFGKGIAKMIEEGKHTELLPDLIVYEKPEFEIKVEVIGVPMLAYLDGYDPVNNVFLEYKTGKIPWTQAKVQKHDQLTLYATMLKALTGKMPEYCDLYWIETKEEKKAVEYQEEEEYGGGLQNDKRIEINVTGHIIPFHREFDEREIDRMEFVIQKAAEEISEAYQEFIKEI